MRFLMRRRISIRGFVRPSGRRSVTPSLRRLLGTSYAEYSALLRRHYGPTDEAADGQDPLKEMPRHILNAKIAVYEFLTLEPLLASGIDENPV